MGSLWQQLIFAAGSERSFVSAGSERSFVSAGSERSFLLARCCCGQSVFALFGHMVPLSPRHCLPSVFAGVGKGALSVRESLMPFSVDNTWLSVERLASFVASVCDTTWFFKNAWRPLWRPFVRRLVFVVAL